MKYGTSEQETCTIKRMSVPTWSIFTAAAGLLVLGTILSLCKLGRQRFTLALGYLVLGLFFSVLMVGAAFAGALCFGQIGINMFAVSIWVLAMAFMGCLFVVIAANGHGSSSWDDKKVAAKGTFDEEAVGKEEDEERKVTQANSTKHDDEEVNVSAPRDSTAHLHPVEESMISDAMEGRNVPASSDTKNTTAESNSFILNEAAENATSFILRDLSQSESESRSVATGDTKAGKNPANSFDKSIKQSPVKATEQDTPTIRKMKETLVDSRTKKSDEVSVSDRLPVVSPHINDAAPYQAGTTACGFEQPFEDVFSFAKNFFTFGKPDDMKSPASPRESYFRLKEDKVEEWGGATR